MPFRKISPELARTRRTEFLRVFSHDTYLAIRNSLTDDERYVLERYFSLHSSGYPSQTLNYWTLKRIGERHNPLIPRRKASTLLKEAIAHTYYLCNEYELLNMDFDEDEPHTL